MLNHLNYLSQQGLRLEDQHFLCLFQTVVQRRQNVSRECDGLPFSRYLHQVLLELLSQIVQIDALIHLQEIAFVLIEQEVHLVCGFPLQLVEILFYGLDSLSVSGPRDSCELVLYLLNLEEEYVLVLLVPPCILEVPKDVLIEILLDRVPEYL